MQNSLPLLLRLNPPDCARPRSLRDSTGQGTEDDWERVTVASVEMVGQKLGLRRRPEGLLLVGLTNDIVDDGGGGEAFGDIQMTPILLTRKEER